MSTNFFNGYNEAKPTSKVLAPPGGRSNNIFGGGQPDEEPRAQAARSARAQQQSSIFGDNTNYPQDKGQQQQNHGQSQQQAPQPQQQQSNHNHSHHQQSKRTGFNPITGESYDNNNENARQKEEPVKQIEPQVDLTNSSNAPAVTGSVASSRVLQPPGGRSTKLW